MLSRRTINRNEDHPMDTLDNDALFDVFKTAIMSEHESYNFYLKAAETTSNAEAKRLFEQFAAVELKHERELEALYRTLKK
jgi:rubrerythrin